MEQLDQILEIVDYSLNTKRKRHITGGVLMSVSLLFGGLAMTIITMKEQDSKQDNK